MERLRLGVIAGFVLGTSAAWASATLIPTFSYEEMFAKSDLVVIARPTASRDTGERKLERQVKPAVPIAGVLTDCDALLVLKGVKNKKFKIHHYRGASHHAPDTVVIGAPVGINLDKGKRYLMFLVRAGNKFVPFAGQMDVEAISVQEISGISYDH